MKKTAKRTLSLLVCLVLLVTLLPQLGLSAEAVRGSCGKNLKWTLSDTGTLTISGTGAIPDYYAGDEIDLMDPYWEPTYPPWDSYSKNITNVVILDGVPPLEMSHSTVASI